MKHVRRRALWVLAVCVAACNVALGETLRDGATQKPAVSNDRRSPTEVLVCEQPVVDGIRPFVLERIADHRLRTIDGPIQHVSWNSSGRVLKVVRPGSSRGQRKYRFIVFDNNGKIASMHDVAARQSVPLSYLPERGYHLSAATGPRLRLMDQDFKRVLGTFKVRALPRYSKSFGATHYRDFLWGRVLRTLSKAPHALATTLAADGTAEEVHFPKDSVLPPAYRNQNQLAIIGAQAESGRQSARIWAIGRGNFANRFTPSGWDQLLLASVSDDYPSGPLDGLHIVADLSAWRGAFEIIAGGRGEFVFSAVPVAAYKPQRLSTDWPSGFAQSTFWQRRDDNKWIYKIVEFSEISHVFEAHEGTGRKLIRSDLKRVLVQSSKPDKFVSLSGTFGISGFDLSGRQREHCEFKASGGPALSPDGGLVAVLRDGTLGVYNLQ